MARMLKIRLKEPYRKGNMSDYQRSNISEAKGKKGIYMIYKNGTLRYIGYSETDLEKTCLRHFQSWADDRQVRVTYKRQDCKVRLCIINSARSAALLEEALIFKHKPIDNPNKLRQLELSKQHFEVVTQFVNENQYWKEGEPLPF